MVVLTQYSEVVSEFEIVSKFISNSESHDAVFVMLKELRSWNTVTLLTMS